MNTNFLLSNLGEPVGETLSHLARTADEVRLAVSYVSNSNLIETLLKRRIAVKLVVALQPPTDAKVLRRLLNSYPVDFEAKFYSRRFHSKLFIFLKDKAPVFAQVGSSNLTGGGLRSNLETNVILHDPVQLKSLDAHFTAIWKQGAYLEPDDIDRYDAYCRRTAHERDHLKRLHDQYELRSVIPRIRMAQGGHPYKQARDYLAFWKSVDEVAKSVEHVSRKEWPTVPLYLTVDHFWHWLVKVWDRQGLESISSAQKLRSERLPELFSEYAKWDKQGENYTGGDMKRNSNFLRRVLSRKRLPNLTKALAGEVYGRLHSGNMRTRRFGGDAAFVESNPSHKIKRALTYLLWSDADVQDRISALLPGGQHRLNELAASGVQELLGWVNPDAMPLRNRKADQALELLGFHFR